MTAIKPAILRLKEYHVPLHPGLIKLNQNESPWDVPDKIKTAVCRRLVRIGWNRYPENGAAALREKLALYTGHSPDGILAGNGSNELIQTIISACCRKGDRILTVTPGFSVYRHTATTQNIRTMEVPLKKDFSFDLQKIVEASRLCRATFITSPNNPTGTWITKEDIAWLAAASPSLIVADEAYFEFSGRTAISLLSSFQNMIILRTFSKALSLAGLRLGYLLGRPDLVRELRKTILPFSVGAAQQAAGEALLESSDLIKARAKAIIQERENLFQALTSLRGITPVPSAANFILFEANRIPGKILFRKLINRGVLTRHFESPALKNMLRVTVGRRAENRVFLKSLESILLEEDKR
jgi:histidinol-phosphate aminotransferase